MKTIIVIPTYNEAENIEKLILQIFNLNIADLASPNQGGLEIIVVDDNSPDGTADIVENLTHCLPIHLIKRKGKLGLGSAYITGFKKALSLGADFIFEMDADFSHNPKDIPRMLEKIKHADLVIGSRKVKGGKVVGWGWWRKFMSNGAMWFSRLILGLKTKDVTAGFRCFKREVLEKLDLERIKSNGYAFQEEMLYKTQKAGFKIAEIPVTFIDRQKGKSKLGGKDVIEFFINMFRLRIKK